MIRTVRLAQITAVGAAGSGAGSATTTFPVNGLLLRIKITQGNTPHANTDITITITDGLTTDTLLTLIDYDTTTGTWFAVREFISGVTGTASTTESTPIAIDGYVTATVAQGGDAATLDVVIQYEDGRR